MKNLEINFFQPGDYCGFLKYPPFLKCSLRTCINISTSTGCYQQRKVENSFTNCVQFFMGLKPIYLNYSSYIIEYVFFANVVIFWSWFLGDLKTVWIQKKRIENVLMYCKWKHRNKWQTFSDIFLLSLFITLLLIFSFWTVFF